MRMKAGSNITTRVPEADRGQAAILRVPQETCVPAWRNHCAGADTVTLGSLCPCLEKPVHRRRHGGPGKPASRPGGTTAQAQTRWPQETCVPAWRNQCTGADTVLGPRHGPSSGGSCMEPAAAL